MKIGPIERDLRMGSDHPIIWTRCLGRGRTLYSALGHEAAAWTTEAEHTQMIAAGIEWLLERPASGCQIGSR